MKLKGLVMEDFVNYKVPSMFLITSVCDFKCCTEQNIDISVCQNEPMVNHPTKEIPLWAIFNAYKNNDITKAIVVGGLEPMLQFEELFNMIYFFRESGINDPFVIYTGYYPEEIEDKLSKLRTLSNIIVKFGRYLTDKPLRYDEILGVTLASNNQYAEVIS